MAGRETHSGPPATLWELHRAEITGLYLNFSLSHVMAEMERKYKFLANKRMYDARFKKWKVAKYMRRSKKQSTIIQTSPIPSSSSASDSDMDSGIIYTPSSEGSPNVRESPCLDPVMSFSTMLRNEEVLLTTMDIYLKQRMSTIPPDMEADSVINIGTTPVSKKFWSNIENGIYLWKISATFPDKRDRARSALEEAQTIAASALATEPFDFVRKVLLVLSPSNTSVNPPLRRVLLGCIALTSRETLGGFHPITRVCESILIEEGTAVDSISDSIAHELCRNALYHMQELFSHHLGASHAATCKLVKSHIAMERRCGDLERAKQLATSAHRSSIATRGPHSIQAREVAMELAYVLARMGEHDIALALHLEIIQRARNPDRVCVYAMESIAEYHMSSSNTTDAAEWLLKAQTMAMELGLEKIELLHITDKLENVLRRN